MKYWYLNGNVIIYIDTYTRFLFTWFSLVFINVTKTKRKIIKRENKTVWITSEWLMAIERKRIFINYWYQSISNPSVTTLTLLPFHSSSCIHSLCYLCYHHKSTISLIAKNWKSLAHMCFKSSKTHSSINKSRLFSIFEWLCARTTL